jgi:hypothetical protein
MAPPVVDPARLPQTPPRQGTHTPWIGAQRATSLIADGALVEVDPVRGVVRAV